MNASHSGGGLWRESDTERGTQFPLSGWKTPSTPMHTTWLCGHGLTIPRPANSYRLCKRLERRERRGEGETQTRHSGGGIFRARPPCHPPIRSAHYHFSPIHLLLHPYVQLESHQLNLTYKCSLYRSQTSSQLSPDYLRDLTDLVSSPRSETDLTHSTSPIRQTMILISSLLLSRLPPALLYITSFSAA